VNRVRVLSVHPPSDGLAVARDLAASLTRAGAEVRMITSTVDGGGPLPPDVDLVVGHGDVGGAVAARLVDERYPAAVRVHVVHDAAGSPDPVAGAALVVAAGPHLAAEAARLAEEAVPVSPPPVHVLVPDLPPVVVRLPRSDPPPFGTVDPDPDPEPVPPSPETRPPSPSPEATPSSDASPSPSPSSGTASSPGPDETVPPAVPVPPGAPSLRLVVPVVADDGLDRAEFAATVTARLRAAGVDATLAAAGAPDAVLTRLRRIAGTAVRTGPAAHLVPDAVVVPSVRDGWPAVAADAARNGTPVVVSQGSGLGAVLADADLVPPALGGPATVPDGVDPGVLRHARVSAPGDLPALLDRLDDLRLDAWTRRLAEVAADRGGHRRRALALRTHLGTRFAPGRAGAALLAALGLHPPAEDEGPRLARTPLEAHLYVDLRPCDCGETRFERAATVVQLPDGDLGRRYAGDCAGCGRAREFVFRLPDEPLAEPAGFGGSEPSHLLDPGEWLWVAERFAAGGRLAAAADAVEEVLKFAPPGAVEVPGGAVRSRLGLAVYARGPDRFRVAALAALREQYRPSPSDVDTAGDTSSDEPIVGGVVGYRWAFQARHPGSPMLRIRYRAGVPVNPYGYPHWAPYARLMVDLPPADPALGLDAARVVDVVAANLVAARSMDPLWTDDRTTPAGWTWAHQGMTRTMALVPVELHGAFRHQGGVSTMDADRRRRGLSAGPGHPPSILVEEALAEDALAAVEERLGHPLPAAYRTFLGRTNGARPGFPSVHPAAGFVADQRLFGLNRSDWLQDLIYANGFLRDRLTADFLAVGYVQGGLLAVRVRGEDAGSVWWCDDDDPRDRDRYTAAEVCDRLLVRLAADFDEFWLALRAVPADLVDRATASAAGAGLAAPDDLGSGLPRAHRRDT
jgi:hypothetical protein